jgi:TRAP transporter TAXI family solute receptor
MSDTQKSGDSSKSALATPFAVEDGRPRRIRRLRWMFFLLTLALGITAYLFLHTQLATSHRLRMTAGDHLGLRYHLAEILKSEAVDRNLEIELKPSAGSAQGMRMTADREVDVALVQGGIPVPAGIRQVAVLLHEPLHLLVKPKLAQQGLSGLRGAKLNLSTQGSGTRISAERLLQLLGMTAADYEDFHLTYDELVEQSFDELPDGVFVVSALPSPVAENLIRKGFELQEIPLASAMHLRAPPLQEFEIPALTYRAIPAVPPRSIKTVAPMMMIVAHEDVPIADVLRLMETIYDGEFAIEAKISLMNAADVRTKRELPLHPGTIKYLERDQPALDGNLIETFENLRSFIVSAIVAVFLLWRWYAGRKQVGFEGYFDAATRIEFDALRLQRAGEFDNPTRDRLLDELSRLKATALEQYASGNLRGGEALSGFLSHVADVRQCLFP